MATVGFIQPSYSTDEGGSVSIIVQLFSTIALPVMVNFQTMDGTAVSSANGDYTAENTVITFQPGGSTIAFITVQTATDILPEETETFTAVLSDAQPEGRVTVNPSTVTVEIMDTSGTSVTSLVCQCHYYKSCNASPQM